MFDLKKLFLSIGFAFCLSAGVVHATVYNVTNTTDGSGLDQLRGALVDAGNTPGTHTVNVIAGTYYIDPLAIEIGTVSGVDITINGAGPGNTIIDARNLGRGFVINPNADQTNVKVAFNGMTFQNCTSGSIIGGGAVLARNGRGNAISFDNCWFFYNKATHETAKPFGGAICCFDVSLSVNNCTFTGNTAYVGNAGAIGIKLEMGSDKLNSAQINITNSLFSNNKATEAHAGAIYILAVGGPGTFSTSITECTFVANSAKGLVGAIGWTSWIDGSKLNINYNRFLSNTERDHGAVFINLLKQAGSDIINPPSDLLNVKNNWWGCNEGAQGCSDYGISPNGFAEIFTPHLQLKTTVSTQSICYPGTNSVQASTGFTSNSANELIDPSNLGAFIGRPVSISAIPGSMGIISGVQSKIQANGMATANFISNGTPGVVEISSNSDNSSNKAPLTVNTPGSWLGTTSNDWYLPANWCGGAIPTASTNVNIPAGTPNPPVIKISQSEALAKNLTIAPNATLSLDANATLDVKGDFTNNGSFNAGADGAYTLFSGTGTQTIPGGTYSILGISGGNKTLTADATLSHYFVFLSNTKMILGNNTFTVASPSPFNDFNSERYFITNGTGGLRKNVGASAFTFPIGSETSYMPVVLSNTGAPDHFTARVGEGVYTSYLNNVPQGNPIALKAVNSTWYISEDVPGGSNVGMSLYWNPTDELPSFDRSNCYVSHYQNGSWKPTTSGLASGSNPFFASRSGITSFSPFAVTNPDSPLPVTLARFDAVKEGSTALLSWSTTEETNSDRFEVERSINGKTWQKIGTVMASGESKIWTDYRFADEQPVTSEENLYRLKMIDRAAPGAALPEDGAVAYSRIRSLKFDGEASPVVFPNPASDKLFVQDFARVSSLRMMDVSGKVVYQSGTMKTDAINVDKLAAGVHLVEIKWLDGRKSVRKIVINP
nr:T9SS type A sorting domain-containing protein [uncultured Dyadobacter sp.]